MTSEDILTFLGLLVFVVLFAFSIKMAYEHLFKKYDSEIQNYFKRNNHTITLVRKPNAKEKRINPFRESSFRLRGFTVSPRKVYKYRIVEFIDNTGNKHKQWVEITIRYLRKPLMKFK